MPIHIGTSAANTPTTRLASEPMISHDRDGDLQERELAERGLGVDLPGQVDVARQRRQRQDQHDEQRADHQVQRPAEAGGDPRRRLLGYHGQPGP